MFHVMAMTLRELYAETRQLPREQAAELMELLLIDTFSEPDPAVEEAWRAGDRSPPCRDRERESPRHSR
jgi:hypothetical protein